MYATVDFAIVYYKRWLQYTEDEVEEVVEVAVREVVEEAAQDLAVKIQDIERRRMSQHDYRKQRTSM